MKSLMKWQQFAAGPIGQTVRFPTDMREGAGRERGQRRDRGR